MEKHILGPDTQAVLLLCGYLGQPHILEPKPLTTGEYNLFSRWLHDQGMRPLDLLDPVKVRKIFDFKNEKISADRIYKLLERGVALASAVESWAKKGIRVISRTEETYPSRLKIKLKGSSPPILYGAGNINLLEMGGLAIVGSRKVDEDGLSFTRSVASICASGNIQVISGGAKGVDREAEITALSEQGVVTEILSDSLSKASVSGKYREAIRAGKICLVSPFDPEAGFSVGSAMGRNRYIYALADYALVISAEAEKGGTWAGATDNIKKCRTPLFVRSFDKMSDGNKRLIEAGGIPMDPDVLRNESKLMEWLELEAEKFIVAQEGGGRQNMEDNKPVINSNEQKSGKNTPEQLLFPFPD